MRCIINLRRYSIITLSLITFALLPSCIVVVDDDDDDHHYRRRWSLDVIVYGSAYEYPGNDGVYSLTLNENSKLSGSADCSVFEGTYSMSDDNALSIQGLTPGNSVCGANSLKSRYLDGLEKARAYSASEDEFVIYFGDTGNSMRFSPSE